MKEKYLSSELKSIYGISDILVNKVDNNNNTIKLEEPSKLHTKSYSDWEELEKAMSGCKTCRLSKTRINIVYGEGNKDAKLLFLGEGPGKNEDETGLPFVGKAGQLLTKMIEAMKFTREEVYITNVVKCRPPNNRDPLPDEVSSCIPFLDSQIKLINPEVIVCLGFVATKRLIPIDSERYTIRGKWQEYMGIKVMPTYHPAYLLYNPSKKKDVWDDLQEVMKYFNKL